MTSAVVRDGLVTAPSLPTLVLLPGTDGTGVLFEQFIARLGSEVRPIVVSYPRDEQLDYSALAQFVQAKLPIDRSFFLLGESFSGPIAIALAAAAPPGLCGLILCCTFARSPRPWLRWARSIARVIPLGHVPLSILSWFLLGRYETPALRQALRQVLTHVNSAVLSDRLAQTLVVDVTKHCAKLHVPTLCLGSRQDRLVPWSATQLIARQIPRARVAEINGPHQLLQAAPDAAAAHVLRFIREVRQSSSSTAP